MAISRFLGIMMILCLLTVPAFYEQIQKSCMCTSAPANSNSQKGLSCSCAKHNEKTCSSQGCHCIDLLPSSSNAYVYDFGCSGIAETSPRINGRLSQSTTGNDSIIKGRFSNSYQANSNDRPPDLDFVDYLPPSAKHVFEVLATNGPLTQKDLISKADLPPRTVRYALNKLKGEDILEERFCFRDARQSIYSLAVTSLK